MQKWMIVPDYPDKIHLHGTFNCKPWNYLPTTINP